MHILIIDDGSPETPDLASKLTTDGFHVEKANDAREALTSARRMRPDVIIADVDMPSLDIQQFAQYVRKTRWGRMTALIARTSHGSAANKDNALAAGFDLYLCRPIRFEVIESLLEKCR